MPDAKDDMEIEDVKSAPRVRPVAVAEPPAPVRAATRVFTEDDTHQTWRIVSRNTNYNGETEGIGFSNGEAVATAIPSIVSCPYESMEACAGATEGRLCRIHRRVRQLNGFMGYPYIYRVKNARGVTVTRREPGYRVLTEEQYEAEFGDSEADGDELPEDF